MPVDILTVNNLDGGYEVFVGKRKVFVHAVDNVSLTLHENEVLGIAGESGCGKSTLAKMIYGAIIPPLVVRSGDIYITTRNSANLKLNRLSIDEIRKRIWWLEISYIPQNSMNVLNPLKRIKDQFLNVFKYHDIEIDKEDFMKHLREMLNVMGLPPEVINAYPHQLSGGMRQRVVIALSLLFNPRIVIADEPTTAVDVVTQRTILSLIKGWRENNKSSLILISHDMSVHAYMDDRIAIMYAGNIVEIGNVFEVFKEPLHPYTKALIDSLIRKGDRTIRKGLMGQPPDLINPPPGCRFHPRCPFAMDICRVKEPPTIFLDKDRYVKCWLYVNTR
ncbi:ABC transporter ATP-binding protein [Ignisphaera sp. 4213-co]|uniref:ABC transporter ATP-binding protein n=1 Tax=Ignisphaera cupida TaxID=3050454 RepID=A0ABD4Z6H5_9CREN|nr:ABC transporter ATP-binding protein [Ignisphaera sp. 4213-co]MDK6028829.1 ABC transporter ATP-binding protein [Ignisphaera sp. 4213-co]